MFFNSKSALSRNMSENAQKKTANEILQNSLTMQSVIELADVWGNKKDADLAKVLCDLPALKTTSKRKIKRVALHYCRVYNGGVERVLSHLSFILAKAGFAPVLFTEEPPNSLDYEFSPQTERVVLPKCETTQEKIAAISAAITENEIDVWWEHQHLDGGLLWNFLAAKSAGVPAVLTWHCNAFFYFRYDILGCVKNFFVKRLFDRVFVLSNCDNLFARDFGMKSFFAPNPVELNVVAKPQKCGEKPVVLWLARMDAGKFPEDIVPIAEKFLKVNQNARFLIGAGKGDDELEKRVLAQIERSEFHDRIEYLGFVQDIDSVYAQSDIFLFTSIGEGFPMTLLEAKSRGLPIVAYDLPYLETMKDGTGVLKVAQRDVQGAADAILRLIADPALYKKCSREALADAKHFAEFDLGKFYAEQFESLCDENYEFPKPDETAKIMLETMMDAIENGSASDKQLDDIRSSLSWRIGRKITWLPRKVRGTFRWLKTRGLKATIRHAGGYILKKLKVMK